MQQKHDCLAQYINHTKNYNIDAVVICMNQQHVRDRLLLELVMLVVVVMSLMSIVYQFDHEPGKEKYIFIKLKDNSYIHIFCNTTIDTYRLA
jgi:hypothetical protein